MPPPPVRTHPARTTRPLTRTLAEYRRMVAADAEVLERCTQLAAEWKQCGALLDESVVAVLELLQRFDQRITQDLGARGPLEGPLIG